MLPSQRSIFHLGEEGGDADRGNSTNGGARRHGHGGRSHGRDAGDAVVGLRILVTHHARAASHSHIVMKQIALPTPAAARHRRGPCSIFLRACSRCRRELSPNKDVYMYRGDQGFCSQECRWQQILVDEAREREAMMKKERRGMSLHHHHGTRSTAAIRGAPPRRLLAVA